MLSKLMKKIWNRRKDKRRMILSLPVRAIDAEGNSHEVISDDLSDRGVRIRVNEDHLKSIVGHREEIPLEIVLKEDVPPLKAQAELMWAYNTPQGGSVSGWRFVHFKGNARRRLRSYLDEFETDGGLQVPPQSEN